MSKRFVLSSAFFSVSVVALIAMTASPASAVKEFRDAFKSKYVKSDSTAANDVALAAAVDETSPPLANPPFGLKRWIEGL